MAYGENMSKLSPCGSALVLDLLTEACPAPRSLLDAGCGRGERLADLGRALPGVRLCGVDCDEENAGKARARCPEAEIVTGDVCAMPWPDGSFDAALCECTLSLLPRPEDCLAELRRLLRPGGVLLLSDLCAAGNSPAREEISPDGAVRWLATRAWTESAAAGAGFRTVRSRDCGEELLAMAAELIFSGGCACVGTETLAALRRRRAGYMLWILERSTS